MAEYHLTYVEIEEAKDWSRPLEPSVITRMDHLECPLSAKSDGGARREAKQFLAWERGDKKNFMVPYVHREFVRLVERRDRVIPFPIKKRKTA